jgi:hypothetical protein
MKRLIISHKGKTPKYKQKILGDFTDLVGLIHYDFSVATSIVDTNELNTVVDGLYKRAYNFGTFSQGSLVPLVVQSYIASYEYSSEVQQSIIGLSGGNYGVATFSIIDPLSLSSDFTFFGVVKTPTQTILQNDKFFEVYSEYRNLTLIWNDSLDTAGSIGFQIGLTQSANSTYKSLYVGTSSWCLIKATGSYSSTQSSLNLTINGVTASSSFSSGYGLSGTQSIIGVLISVGTYSSMKVGEIFLERTAYSLDQLNITENYLKNKWNISY